MICSCETTDLLAHCVAQEPITSFLKEYYRWPNQLIHYFLPWLSYSSISS